VKRHFAGTVLYYGHDLHWKRLEREYKVTKQRSVLIELADMQALEDSMCEKATVALYPTAQECEEIRRRLPQATVADIPAYLYDEAFIAESERRIAQFAGRDRFHLLFVGGFGHRPNIDAVLWFVTKVLPRLRKQDERYRLTVVGSAPTTEIRELATASVTVTGQVSDAVLAELYKSAGIAVVPLRFGGGLKGKVIEAFANAIPVVTTTTGLQGIREGETMAALADGPAGFAKAVVDTGADAELAAARLQAAIAFVRRRFSSQAIRDVLLPYVPELRADEAETAASTGKPMATRRTRRRRPA
jgi:glycosyltransferase involved in cell wall biosynthesis